MDNNYSYSFLMCFFQYVLLFKRFEKKYHELYIEYQKHYLENFLNRFNITDEDEDESMTQEKEKLDVKKDLLELFITFFF